MKLSYTVIILIIFSALVFGSGISRIPVLDNDAAGVSLTAKHMAQTDDTFIKLNGTKFHKPPGIYWLQATASRWLSPQAPNASWPYRVPSLIGALLAVLLTLGMAKRYFSAKTGALAAALLASSLLLIIEAHLAAHATVLLALVVVMQGALWRLVQPIEEKPHSLLWLGLFWSSLTASLFIDAIAPLYTLSTLVFLCCWDRSWKYIKMVKPAYGLALLCGVALVWHYGFNHSLQSVVNWNFIRTELAPSLHGAQWAPPGFYLVLLPLTLWPGGLFLGHGIITAWQQRQQASIRFCIAWIVPSWLLLALVPGKLPHYLLPVYPAITLLIAYAIEQFQIDTSPRWGRYLLSSLTGIWTLISFGLIWLMVLLPYYITRQVCISHTVISSILMILIGVILQYKAEKPVRSALLMPFASLLLLAPTLHFSLPEIKQLWLSHQVATTISTKFPNAIDHHTPLITTYYRAPSLQFELGNNQLKFVPLKRAITMLRASKSKLYLLTQHDLEHLKREANQLRLPFHNLENFSGIDYGHRKWLTLSLVRIG